MTGTLSRRTRAGERCLRDRALGEGQVLEQDVQTPVLFIEKLLHPPAESKVLRVTSREDSAQVRDEQAKEGPLTAPEHNTIPHPQGTQG